MLSPVLDYGLSDVEGLGFCPKRDRDLFPLLTRSLTLLQCVKNLR